jgi:hypothetical protein
MRHETDGWFGDGTANVQVPVVSPLPDDARFVVQSVPATMTAGQQYNITVRMRNSGATTWTASAGYQLVSQRPQGNTTWGISAVNLPAALPNVRPGGELLFTFTVTAPPMGGDCAFEWRMVRNGLGFGDFTPVVTIRVVP